MFHSIPEDFSSQVNVLGPFSSPTPNSNAIAIDGNTRHVDLSKYQAFPANPRVYMPWHNQHKWHMQLSALKKLRQESMHQHGSIDPLRYYFQTFIHNGTKVKLGGLEKAVAVLLMHGMSADFHSEIVPFMADLVINSEQIFPPGRDIPRLYAASDMSLTLSSAQCACLLSHGFFNTYGHKPNKWTDSPFTLFHLITTRAYGNKLACILSYFIQIRQSAQWNHFITFYRAILPFSENETISNLGYYKPGSLSKTIARAEYPIDWFSTCLQVDFADSRIGGLVLGKGIVQEEIMFCLRPEMIVAMLFTDQFKNNECMQFTGPRRYSKTQGYAKTFQYRGPFLENVPKDHLNRFMINICAIDAIHYKANNIDVQFSQSLIRRELMKAFCGFIPSRRFQNTYLNVIATGNWGCGVFNGDRELKFVIQLLAATLAGSRNMIYSTFHDKVFAKKITDFCSRIQYVPPKLVYDAVCSKRLTNSVFDNICIHLKV